MTRIFYAVTATLPDEQTAREYLAWLEDGHVDAVIDAGAHSGMIVRLDPDPPEMFPDSPSDTPPGNPRPRVETQYVFATRERFDRYVQRDAPALRADGLKRFPPERGIVFARRTGVIV